LRTH